MKRKPKRAQITEARRKISLLILAMAEAKRQRDEALGKLHKHYLRGFDR